jgi:outer membrane protein
LPQVSGSALYERIHGSAAARPTTTTTGATGGTTTTPTVGTASTYDFWSFGISASQLLWDFNQTWNRYKSAVGSEEALRISERTSELTVVLNARRAYFNARAQRALVQVANETLTNEQKHYTQIAAFVSVGTHPEIDLAKEKTTLANDRVALINAEGAYEIARAQLNQAMGVVSDTDYEVADEALPAIDGEDTPDGRLVEVALAQRPEILSLEKSRAAQERTIASFKGGYGPSLSAIGGASYSGTALDSLGTNWNVGASLVWPFFQGGLTNGQVREGEANLDALRAQIDQEKLQVRFDVQQATLTVRIAKASIGAANEALTNAREQLRLAEGRYTQGVGSIIELGDAQVTLTNAGAQVVQAEFNLATARAQLLTALGKR